MEYHQIEQSPFILTIQGVQTEKISEGFSMPQVLTLVALVLAIALPQSAAAKSICEALFAIHLDESRSKLKIASELPEVFIEERGLKEQLLSFYIDRIQEIRAYEKNPLGFWYDSGGLEPGLVSESRVQKIRQSYLTASNLPEMPSLSAHLATLEPNGPSVTTNHLFYQVVRDYFIRHELPGISLSDVAQVAKSGLGRPLDDIKMHDRVVANLRIRGYSMEQIRTFFSEHVPIRRPPVWRSLPRGSFD